MYPIFTKLFGSDEKGWNFLRNSGFSLPRISNFKRRGLSSFAKEILLIEATRKKIRVQPNDFYTK